MLSAVRLPGPGSQTYFSAEPISRHSIASLNSSHRRISIEKTLEEDAACGPTNLSHSSRAALSAGRDIRLSLLQLLIRGENARPSGCCR
jgi:hypothetical protein